MSIIHILESISYTLDCSSKSAFPSHMLLPAFVIVFVLLCMTFSSGSAETNAPTVSCIGIASSEQQLGSSPGIILFQENPVPATPVSEKALDPSENTHQDSDIHQSKSQNSAPTEDNSSAASDSSQESETPHSDSKRGPSLETIDDFNYTIGQSSMSVEEIQANMYALEIIGQYAGQAELDANAQCSLQEAMDILKSLNGSKIMELSKGLFDNELADTLHHVATYASLNDAVGNRLQMPVLCVSALLNYFRPYVQGPVYERAVGILYYLIPHNYRIITPLADLLGSSKSFVYNGKNSLVQKGLDCGSEKCNAPGAGRTNAATLFQQHILSECKAAQVDEAQLEYLHTQRQLEDSGISGVPNLFKSNENHVETGESDSDQMKSESDTQKSQSDQAKPDPYQTESASDQAKPKADPFFSPFDTMGWYLDQIHSVVPALNEKLLTLAQRLSRNHIRTPYLLNTASLLVKTAEDLDVRYHELRGLDYERIFFTVLDQDGEVSPERAGEIVHEVNFLPFRFRVLNNAIINCLSMCDALATTFSEIERNQEAPFCAAKIISVSAHVKSNSSTFRHDQELDSLILKAIADEKAIDGKKFNNNITDSIDFDYMSIYDHHKETLGNLDVLAGRLNAQLASEVENTSAYNNLNLAITQLQDIRRNLKDIVETTLLTNKNPEVTASLSIIIETYRDHVARWLKTWDECPTTHSSARKVSLLILDTHFVERVKRLYEDFCFAVSDSKEENIPHQAENDDTPSVTMESVEYDAESLQKAKEEALKSIQETRQLFSDLIGNLSSGAKAWNKRQNSKKHYIQEAIDLLNSFLAQLDERFEQIQGSDNADLWKAMLSATMSLNSMLQGWVNKWEKTDEGFKTSFSTARLVSESVLKPKHKNNVDRIWKYYEFASQPESSNSDSFITVDIVDNANLWFQPGNARLSPLKRLELIRKFVSQGKDPTDIKVWIDYIVCAESSRTYIDPTNKTKCCAVTKAELCSAFTFLTSVTYAPNTLWSILKNDMHYTGRQCAKLDQIGKPHELRDKQFDYITSRRNAVDKSKTLCLSIDTKAFILLGRLKHDNGVLLCSPDGRVYRVYDHDYGFLFKDIYSKPNRFVGKDRMNEKAVLHPVGAWCLNDQSGYVSLVAGKDTAESMCNLIEKVVSLKRQEMPGLDSILLLADGGGANMANGITWLDNLLDLSKKLNLQIEVCHYAPGCSRHNPVEGSLWSPISIHWKGKPFLDIEHVLHYIGETKTGKKRTNVKCWFDTRKYLTNAQKKERGLSVLTRSELDKKAAGRIKYAFNDGTDMHKWNYVISPSAENDEVKAA